MTAHRGWFANDSPQGCLSTTGGFVQTFNNLMRATVLFSVASLLSIASCAASAATLGFNPNPINAAPGQSFSVDVTIASVSNLADFQFNLGFNPSLLQATGVSEGPFLSTGGPTIFEPGAINNTAGQITLTAGALENGKSVSGSGVLATFDFKAIADGTGPLTITNVTLLDPNLGGIDAGAEPGTVIVGNAPEPASALLIAGGLALLCIFRLRRTLRQHLRAMAGAGVAAVLLASGAQAELITSPTALGPQQTVVDFGQFAGNNTARVTSPVPVAPGVTLSSTNPDGSLLGSGPYSLNDNGVWTFTLAGLDIDAFGRDQYTMTFHFTNPVAGVGGLINYATFAGSGFSNVIMAALDANGGVLESWDINKVAPISTPDGINQGAFLGIALPAADISYLTLSNSAVAITDLTFTSTTPEPASFALVFAGILMLGAAGRLLPRRVRR
jgi:hypothetical protein